MRYYVITKENFSDIEKIQENARNDINKRYELDRFDNYAHEQFAIIGDDAIKLFCEKYGYNITNRREAIKTDGKTKAEFIPYITAGFYYDARNKQGGIVDVYNHTIIDYLISFDGVLFQVPAWCSCSVKKTVSLYLFNDGTDYRKYLDGTGFDRENPAPNNIGTITDKKINDWKNYLLLRKKTAEDNKKASENKVADFLAKVRAFDTTGATNVRLSDRHGIIERNGLRYSYDISDNGYISQKIEVAYIKSDLSTLEKFGKMVNGKL